MRATAGDGPQKCGGKVHPGAGIFHSEAELELAGAGLAWAKLEGRAQGVDLVRGEESAVLEGGDLGGLWDLGVEAETCELALGEVGKTIAIGVHHGGGGEVEAEGEVTIQRVTRGEHKGGISQSRSAGGEGDEEIRGRLW